MRKILGIIYTLLIILVITGCNSNASINDAIAIATDETGTFFINAKKEKLYIKYDDVIGEFSDIIIVRHHNKYGYINNEGKTIIEPQYQMVYPFSENKAVVKLNNQLHIINLENTILYTFSKDTTSTSYFSDGMLVVEQDGKFGYLNDKFNLTIECTFNSAAPFSEGQAVVGKILIDEIRYTYIDKKGNYQLDGTINQIYKYYSASYFNNGYAKVSIDGEHYAFVNEDHYVVLDKIIYARFDIRTSEIIPINEKIDYAQDTINVLPNNKKYFVVAYNSKVGKDYFIYDVNKNILYNHYYTKHRLGVVDNNYLPINLNNGSYELFHFTVNPIYNPESKLESEKFPYYFKTIKILSTDTYSKTPMGLSDFRNGYASFYTIYHKYGLIDTEGNVILEAKYTQIKY